MRLPAAIETNGGTTDSTTYIALEVIWGEAKKTSLVFSIKLHHSMLNLVLFEQANTGSDDKSPCELI